MQLGENVWKVLLGLMGVLAGWLLAQFTSIFKTYLQRWQVKRLLIEELHDIHKESRRLLGFHAHVLEQAGAGCIGNSAVISIANPIFRNYYKDALLGLNQSQRLSYQRIHNIVEIIDSDIIELKKLTNEIQRHHYQNDEDLKIFEEFWKEKIRNGYKHCAILDWHVKHHLDSKHNPDLTPGTAAHTSYQAYVNQIDETIEEFIVSGTRMQKD